VIVPGCVVFLRSRDGCLDCMCVAEFASLRLWLYLIWVVVIVGLVSIFVRHIVFVVGVGSVYPPAVYAHGFVSGFGCMVGLVR
jgi:hypothetical protein